MRLSFMCFAHVPMLWMHACAYVCMQSDSHLTMTFCVTGPPAVSPLSVSHLHTTCQFHDHLPGWPIGRLFRDHPSLAPLLAPRLSARCCVIECIFPTQQHLAPAPARSTAAQVQSTASLGRSKRITNLHALLPDEKQRRCCGQRAA
eukprot:27387-Chlamydomonas_euryale.AAC.8